MSIIDSFTSVRKVLIANRGEIACRIIKSCRALGLTSIAIYSQADRSSLHIPLADEAYLLPGKDQQAYIDGDAILEIAKRTGANALVPGYGECIFATARISYQEPLRRLSFGKCRVCGTSRAGRLGLGWTVGQRDPAVWTETHRKRVGD